jgi:hypothetical protein
MLTFIAPGGSTPITQRDRLSSTATVQIRDNVMLMADLRLKALADAKLVHLRGPA